MSEADDDGLHDREGWRWLYLGSLVMVAVLWTAQPYAWPIWGFIGVCMVGMGVHNEIQIHRIKGRTR